MEFNEIIKRENMRTPENESLMVRDQGIIIADNDIEQPEVYDAEWNEVKERYYIPSAPLFGAPELNDLGCQFDDVKDEWYHTDPDKAKEAEDLMQNRSERRRLAELEKVLKEVSREM